MSHPLIVLSGDIDTAEEVPDACIRPFCEMLESFAVPFTVPVTAEAIQSNPDSFPPLVDVGCELAGHGDIHTPFVGPTSVQRLRLREMNDAFQRFLGLTPYGFRAPYLAHDSNLYSALASEGFEYDSSQTSRDLVLRLRYLLSPRPLTYRDPLRRLPTLFIQHLSGEASFSPRFIRPELVELPVFELDDWFYFEANCGPKLQKSEEALVAELWWRTAQRVIKRGNPFVVQAHPKRISPSRLAVLGSFVEKARAFGCEFLTLHHLSQRYKDKRSSA